ncbi:unnamed protein product [Sphenostylis stenocarpa]|uniref:Uncharacterized protein n=1 Tax=Sphenostylis stenocarpa TaxID=92480 RepID=A0AA86SE75_9FABA|nr:unnamed protein product [Sphenostylis stenocarpa]
MRFETSSSPTFYGIVKKKSVEEFKPDPYIATVLNCAFWAFYGMPFVHPNSVLVLPINSVGLRKVLIFLLIEALITMLALHGTKKTLVVGILADVFFNVMMYVSPLTVMVL